jgi:Ser/Thr protein kinase RdoA (MazF antagonist)
MIKTILDKEELDNILSNYKIGKCVSLKIVPNVLENTVYFFSTNSGKYVFKVLENSMDELVRYEVNFVNYLKCNGVPVQEIISDNEGRLFNKYISKNFIIFKYVEGKHPKKLTPLLVKEFAQQLSYLHKVSLDYKAKKDYYWFNKNTGIGLGYQFSMGDNISENILGFPLKKEYEKLTGELKINVNKDNLRGCIIHSDHSSGNSLVKNNKIIAFIDWNDIHKDYLAFDLSVFIADSFITYKPFIKKFFDNYSIKLNNDEKKAIYYFIKNRKLGEIKWCNEQINVHPDKKEKLTKNIKDVIDEYKEFNEMFSLKDFLKLMD